MKLLSISTPQIISTTMIVAVSLAIVVLMLAGARVFFKGMQQRGYHAVGYLNWINRSNNRFMYRLSNVCIFSMVAYITFSVIFAPFSGKLFSYLGLVFFYVFTMVFFKTNKLSKETERQPLVYTDRLKRLVFTFCVLVFAISIATFLSMNAIHANFKWRIFNYTRYVVVCIFPLLLPFIVLLANAINIPLENMHIASFGKKAREILEKRDIKVVAVTGSFGKTTTKDIITSILSAKYITASAPKSFNTPSGVAMTIQNFVTENTEVVVLEMGARKVGEIAKLCKIAKPDYAVITNVGNQHIESFKNFENIARTKFEIVENIKEGGSAFFNCADAGCKQLFDKATTNKHSISETSGDLVFNVQKVGKEGSEFSVCIDGETHNFTTVLLGRHNVANVAMGILVAKKMGMDMQTIKTAVAKLQATQHRLQIVKNDDTIVIDDSYNSNLKGVRYATDVLSMFEGRKIIVTPGLVEMGKMEDEANGEVGRIIGSVADKIVLVGNTRSIQITKGLADVGFNFENLLVFENFIDAQNSLSAIVRRGDVVLFENDIPDSYL